MSALEKVCCKSAVNLCI